MADTTKDIWNDSDGEAPKGHSRVRSFLLFLLLLVLVLAVVVVAAYRDGTGFDALRRYFSYGSVEASSGETIYRYEVESSNRFAVLGDRLVVLSDTSLSLLGSGGETVWSAPVQMTNPALSIGGGHAAAYDVGGRTLYVLDKNGPVLELMAEDGQNLLSATLNGQGMLAVTAQRENYKGNVSVYNAKMKLIFEFNSSRRFVADACVTEDGKMMAAVTLGQENSVFVSDVVLYDLTQKDPVANYNVEDGLTAAIAEKDGALISVSDTCVTFADRKGGINSTYDYSDLYLRGYDLGGDGFVALQLNRYQSGSVGRLVTLDSSGRELAVLDISDEVRSISASGRYLAVLYNDRLEVYNQDLQTYAVMHGADRIREVLMRSDGSAVLVAAGAAELFLP